jgi:hypothetical protein
LEEQQQQQQRQVNACWLTACDGLTPLLRAQLTQQQQMLQ